MGISNGSRMLRRVIGKFNDRREVWSSRRSRKMHAVLIYHTEQGIVGGDLTILPYSLFTCTCRIDNSSLVIGKQADPIVQA